MPHHKQTLHANAATRDAFLGSGWKSPETRVESKA